MHQQSLNVVLRLRCNGQTWSLEAESNFFKTNSAGFVSSVTLNVSSKHRGQFPLPKRRFSVFSFPYIRHNGVCKPSSQGFLITTSFFLTSETSVNWKRVVTVGVFHFNFDFSALSNNPELSFRGREPCYYLKKELHVSAQNTYAKVFTAPLWEY